MDISRLFQEYDLFRENAVSDRFLKHDGLLKILKKLPEAFSVKEIGQSEEGRSLNLISWGYGELKIFLWSQMHGNEATGTMALLDLFNFLRLKEHQDISDLISTRCTIFMLPMVNPDGAERFTRRNARQIDINRDFLKTSSAEATILKGIRDHIKPDFGFNLHDQDTLWSVRGTKMPATLSYLAPSYNEVQSINQTRENAMLVVAQMVDDLNNLIPGRIGLFEDEYEPRAFGDNFQLAGTSTILIEAGGYSDDHEKQTIRKYYFLSILSGLYSVANMSYSAQTITAYFAIPQNEKRLFHILIHDVIIDGMKTSIGINYEQTYIPDTATVKRSYSIEDIGDLSFSSAYKTHHCVNAKITGKITVNTFADFRLSEEEKIIFSFNNGILS